MQRRFLIEIQHFVCSYKFRNYILLAGQFCDFLKLIFIIIRIIKLFNIVIRSIKYNLAQFAVLCHGCEEEEEEYIN